MPELKVGDAGGGGATGGDVTADDDAAREDAETERARELAQLHKESGMSHLVSLRSIIDTLGASDELERKMKARELDSWEDFPTLVGEREEAARQELQYAHGQLLQVWL